MSGPRRSKSDIVTCIHEVMMKTEKWLSNKDYSAKIESFPWAGEKKLGVVIFLLRYIIFHIDKVGFCI